MKKQKQFLLIFGFLSIVVLSIELGILWKYQARPVPELLSLPTLTVTAEAQRPAATEPPLLIIASEVSSATSMVDRTEAAIGLEADIAPSVEPSAVVPPTSANIPDIGSPSPLVVGNAQVMNETVAGVTVVSIASDADSGERQAYIQEIVALGGTVTEIPALNSLVVNLPVGKSLPSAAIIQASEPDYFVMALEDPFLSEQYAIDMIGAKDAWANLPADAPTVLVAVIDSGVNANHEDLQGRIVSQYDFVEDDTFAQDDFGHGTSVAGIVAANHNALGIAGIAPNAQIMALRVLDAQGMGRYSNVAEAIIYATDNHATIINLSLGGTNTSQLLRDAIDYAIAHGVHVVAAAGNQGAAEPMEPARYAPVISVGALDSTGTLAVFSNLGADILAPGVNILTTLNTGDYGQVSGTSFAAPFVSAALALEGSILDNDILSLSLSRTSELLIPTATNLPETAIPTAQEFPAGEYLIYEWHGNIYGQLIDESFAIDFGNTVEGMEKFFPDNLEINKLEDSPISMSSLTSGYGYFTGIWSADRTKFAFMELEANSSNYQISILENGTVRSILQSNISENRGYLIPLGWNSEDTILLQERYIFDSTQSVKIWSLDTNNSSLNLIINQEYGELIGRSIISHDGSIAFLGANVNTQQGYFINLIDLTIFESVLGNMQAITQQSTAIDATELHNFDTVFTLAIISSNALPAFQANITDARISPQFVTGAAYRPAPFLYWPLADNQRTITYYPNTPWQTANGKTAYSDHRGTDIGGAAGLPMGTPIYAAASGTVVYRENACPNNVDGNGNPIWYVYPNVPQCGLHNWGNNLVLSHTVIVNGNSQIWYSAYAHLLLNSIAFSNGNFVSVGQQIAQSGHSGASTGPHLHFEVRNSAWNGSGNGWDTWDDPWGSTDAPYGATLWVGGTGHPTSALNATSSAPSNVNLISNSNFDGGELSWSFSNNNHAVYTNAYGISGNNFLAFHTAVGKTVSSVEQYLPYSLASGSSFELRTRIGNPSNVWKRVRLHVVPHNAWTGGAICNLYLPPQTSLQSYTVQGKTSAEWSQIRVYLEEQPDAGTGIADIIMDDVELYYYSDVTYTGTTCSTGIPSILQPTQNQVLASRTFNVQVQRSGSGNKNSFNFLVEVATNSGFTPLAYTSPWSGNLTGTTGTMSITLPNSLSGTLYMRVKQTDVPNGDPTFVMSSYSPPRTFSISIPITAPTLTAPASSVTSSRPVISWTSVAGATGFELQIDAGTGSFLNVRTISVGRTITSYTPPLNLMSTNYKVRIRTVVGADRSAWSTRNFTINNLAAVPSVWYFNAASPVLTWQAVLNASQYQLVIDDGNTATAPLVYTTASLQYNVPSLLDGTYTYKVRALVNGTWSVYTPIDSFIVDVR